LFFSLSGGILLTLTDHWVVVEDYSVLKSGIINYDIVPSSINDTGNAGNGYIERSFTSGSTNNSKRKGKIDMIQVFSVRRK
jgi:hypothetical protein